MYGNPFPAQVPMGNSWGPWHMARGGLPSTEQGFDVRIRTQHRGQHIYALATLNTPWGPIELMARTDLAVLQGMLGVAGQALAQLGSRLAIEGAMKKVTEVTCSPKKQAAAESLYKRLVAKEPLAWQSARKLRKLARYGDANALEGYQCLRQAHAKAKAVQVGPPKGPGVASGCGSMNSPLGGSTYHPFAGTGANAADWMGMGTQLSGCDSHGRHAAPSASGYYPFQPAYHPPYSGPAGAMISGLPSWVHARLPPKPAYAIPANRGLHATGFAVLTALGRL